MSHWKQLDLSVLSLRELKQLYQRIGHDAKAKAQKGTD